MPVWIRHFTECRGRFTIKEKVGYESCTRKNDNSHLLIILLKDAHNLLASACEQGTFVVQTVGLYHFQCGSWRHAWNSVIEDCVVRPLVPAFWCLHVYVFIFIFTLCWNLMNRGIILRNDMY